MHVDPDELMAYFDGELSFKRAARVEQTLGRDPQSRVVLAEWRAVGDAVRDWSRVLQARSPAAGRLMRPPESQPKVTAISQAPAGSESVRPAAGAALAVSRLSRWRTLGAALALAAATSLLVKSAGFGSRLAPTIDEPGIREGLGLVGRDSRPMGEEQPGAAIEALDLGDRQGTIFLVSAGSELTPVVWVEDDFPSEDGDREETL